MSDPLVEAFQADLGCAAEEAHRLAQAARLHVPRIIASTEDSAEDVVHRLRDPRIFGEFAGSLIHSRDLRTSSRVALAERAFDLLPLPRSEGDVILVAARAPSRLLDIGAFLIEAEAFSVLQLMHLVFAVFLDRALVTGVAPASRNAVLRAVVGLPEASPGLRALYVGMHLAAVSESEAKREVRAVLRSRATPGDVKPLIASILASPDGGAAMLADLAREEGLLASETGVDSPEVVANIPRLPPALSALGRRWLDRAREE